MNSSRAARRKAVKEQRVSYADVSNLQTTALRDAVTWTSYMFSVVFALTLADKRAWKRETIQKLLGEVQEKFAAMDESYVSVYDMEETLRNEYGIDIRRAPCPWYAKRKG